MEDLKELRSLLIKEQYYLDKIQKYNLLDSNSTKLRKELMDLNVKELEVIENKIDTIINKYEDKDEDKDKEKNNDKDKDIDIDINIDRI